MKTNQDIDDKDTVIKADDISKKPSTNNKSVLAINQNPLSNAITASAGT